jgi:hypothetical protein
LRSRGGGAISALAGASFIASAGADDPALTIGYAVPGGTFFLISALRLSGATEED